MTNKRKQKLPSGRRTAVASKSIDQIMKLLRHWNHPNFPYNNNHTLSTANFEHFSRLSTLCARNAPSAKVCRRSRNWRVALWTVWMQFSSKLDRFRTISTLTTFVLKHIERKFIIWQLREKCRLTSHTQRVRLHCKCVLANFSNSLSRPRQQQHFNRQINPNLNPPKTAAQIEKRSRMPGGGLLDRVSLAFSAGERRWQRSRFVDSSFPLGEAAKGSARQAVPVQPTHNTWF